MYAIINTKTQDFLYGTDFSKARKRQKTSKDNAKLFTTKNEADFEKKRRGAGTAYKVVKVILVVEDGGG